MCKSSENAALLSRNVEGRGRAIMKTVNNPHDSVYHNFLGPNQQSPLPPATRTLSGAGSTSESKFGQLYTQHNPIGGLGLTPVPSSCSLTGPSPGLRPSTRNNSEVRVEYDASPRQNGTLDTSQYNHVRMVFSTYKVFHVLLLFLFNPVR